MYHASSGGAECSSALVNLKDALYTLADPWTVTCADADTAGACSALAGLPRAGCLACACVVCAWAWRVGRLLADAGMLTDDDLFIMIPAQPCFCPQCTACWQILKQLCGVMLRSSCRSELLPLARAQSKVRVWCAVQGQSKVPAPQAQIIFSSLPLWSAFFAAVLMQGDSMGPSGWAGGLLILAAGLFASRRS